MKPQFPAIDETNRILGRENYRECAVTIPLFLKDGEWHLLFEVRAEGISQAGEVSFPGGMHEPQDRSFKDTAIRETVEELGISPDKIDVHYQLGTLFTGNGIALSAFVAELDIKDLSDCEFNAAEVASLFSVPLNWFLENEPQSYSVRLEIHPFTDREGERTFHLPAEELKLPQKYHTSWGNHKLPVYLYNTSERLIWGMTAGVVKSFVDGIA